MSADTPGTPPPDTPDPDSPEETGEASHTDGPSGRRRDTRVGDDGMVLPPDMGGSDRADGTDRPPVNIRPDEGYEPPEDQAPAGPMPWERGGESDTGDDADLPAVPDEVQRATRHMRRQYGPTAGGEAARIWGRINAVLFRFPVVGYGLVLVLFSVIWITSHFAWTDTMPGVDAAYHIRMGAVYRDKGPFALTDGRFPWTQASLFTEHWADKEWLFHVALIPFTLGWEEPYPWIGEVSATSADTVIAVRTPVEPGETLNLVPAAGSKLKLGEFVVTAPVVGDSPMAPRALLGMLHPAGGGENMVLGTLHRFTNDGPLRSGQVLVRPGAPGEAVGVLLAVRTGVVGFPSEAVASASSGIDTGQRLTLLDEGRVSGHVTLGPRMPDQGDDVARFTFAIHHHRGRAQYPTEFDDGSPRPMTLENRRAFIDPDRVDIREWYDWIDDKAPKDDVARALPLREPLAANTPFAGEDTLLDRSKIAAGFFVGLLFTIVFAIFRELRVPMPLILATVVMIGGDKLFWRLFMCRPHVLSVALLLLAFLFIVQRRRIALVVLGTIYALSYTAAHAFVVMAILLAFVRVLMDDRAPVTYEVDANGELVRRKWRPPLWLCATLGVMLGFALHPNPVNNVNVFGVQNIAVHVSSFFESAGTWLQNALPIDTLFGVHLQDLTTPRTNLRMGTELNPINTRELAVDLWMWWVPAAALVFVFLVRGQRPSAYTVLAFVLAVAWSVMFFTSQRFMEYAGPFMAVFVGLAAWDVWRGTHFREFFRDSPWRANILVLCSLAFGAACVIYGAGKASDVVHRYEGYPHQREAALFMRSHFRADHPDGAARVFTTDWDDFVGLFHYNAHDYYLVGLDPNYMYFYTPEGPDGERRRAGEVWEMWEALRGGESRIKDPAITNSNGNPVERAWVDVILDVFRPDYVCCENDRSSLRRLLRQTPSHFEEIYAGDRYTIFRVTAWGDDDTAPADPGSDGDE